MCWSLSDAAPQFKATFARYWPNKNLNIKIEVKFLTSMVENLNGKRLTWWPSKFLYGRCVVAWTLGYSVGFREKRGKLQTYIANIGLQVMLLLILLGNITVWQFHVNSAKIWNSFMWQSVWSNFSNSQKFDWYCVNVAEEEREKNFNIECFSVAALQTSHHIKCGCFLEKESLS